MTNSKSRIIIKQFINEYLNGDINNLLVFDIKQLKGNRKYGSCNGVGFDSDNTNISRAVMAVAFEGVWPNFDDNTLNSNLYRGDIINSFNTLFGAPEARMEVLKE
jgi:hypothetical protein